MSQRAVLRYNQTDLGFVRDRLDRLRASVDARLSTDGGAVTGPVQFDDYIQFATLPSETGTPNADRVRVYPRAYNGSATHLYAKDEHGVEYDLCIGGGGQGINELFPASARNDMIISNATPEWELLSGPTELGQLLVASSDPFTPTWSRALPGHIGVGPAGTPSDAILLNIGSSAWSPTSSSYGVKLTLAKTAGATTYSHALYGRYDAMELNHSGGVVGDTYGLHRVVTLTNGTVGQTGANARSAGVEWNSLYLSGGTVTGNAHGGQDEIIASAGTLEGNLYGRYINVVNTGASIDGTAYILGLYGQGVDWALYSYPDVPSALGGTLSVGYLSAPDEAQVEIHQLDDSAAIAGLKIDQRDLDQPAFFVSYGGDDVDMVVIELDHSDQGQLGYDESESRWTLTDNLRVDDTIEDVRVRGELRASHFAMGEAHGLGGVTYIARCAMLRSALDLT